MNKIALWQNVRVDDWAAELAIIASNLYLCAGYSSFWEISTLISKRLFNCGNFGENF